MATKLLIACQADPTQKVLDLADDAMADWSGAWIFYDPA